MMKRTCVAFVCISLTLLGCDDYPKDTHHSLQSLQNRGVLRIGAIEQPPWAYREKGVAKGIEIRLAEGFARSLGVRARINFLSEAEATEHLQHHHLDLVVGGLTKASPRKEELGFTRSYYRTGHGQKDEHVMAVLKGENRFLVRLEKFLKQQQSCIQQYWEAEIHA